MTKVGKKTIAIIGVSALMAMTMLAGCGSDAASSAASNSASAGSGESSMVTMRTIDVEWLVTDDADKATAEKIVQTLSEMEGVFDAKFVPAAEGKNARIEFGVVQGTNVVAIKDTILATEEFANILMPDKLEIIEPDNSDLPDAESSAASSSSDAASSEAASSEAAEPTEEASDTSAGVEEQSASSEGAQQ